VSGNYHKFHFNSFDDTKQTWATYEGALLMALAKSGILEPAEQKIAVYLSLSADVKERVAAHFLPRKITDRDVTIEHLLWYFREKDAMRYTPTMARRDFALCKQGNRSIDEYVSELYRIAGRADLASPDRSILIQFSQGIANEECKRALIRYQFQTADRAIAHAKSFEAMQTNADYLTSATFVPSGILQVGSPPL